MSEHERLSDTLTNIKFCSVSAMVSIHSIVFILNRFENKVNFPTDSSGYLFFMSLGFFSMSLPATAGMMFREGLTPFLYKNRIYNFPYGATFKLFAVLMLMESLKGLMIGLPQFFLWNVLHFSSLCFLIFLILSKVNISLVLPVGVLALLLSEPIRSYLFPFLLSENKAARHLASQGFVSFVLIAMILLALQFGGLWLWRQKQKNAKKITSAFFPGLLMLGLFFGSLFLSSNQKIHFAQILYNLPLAILIGDAKSGHIWSLLPWFSVTAFGFCLCHALMKMKYKKLLRLVLIGLSLCYGVYFYREHAYAYFSSLRADNLWGEVLFNPSSLVILGQLSVFTLMFFLCEAVTYVYPQRRYGLRTIFSESILWIYLIHIPLGHQLSFLFAEYLNFTQALVVFPLIMQSISYMIGIAVVTLTGPKGYRITLAKK